ncbi:MAG: hypothetical protein RI897_252 [Verrucomicrobiota bacterium]|jgi:hypothetical protein
MGRATPRIMRDLQRAICLRPPGLGSAAVSAPIPIPSFLSILLFHVHLQAAELRLALDSLDANRRPTLGLSGLPDGLYAIESSTNLQDWTTVLSASADQGMLSFTPATVPGDRVTYYRGVDLPRSSPTWNSSKISRCPACLTGSAT